MDITFTFTFSFTFSLAFVCVEVALWKEESELKLLLVLDRVFEAGDDGVEERVEEKVLIDRKSSKVSRESINVGMG